MSKKVVIIIAIVAFLFVVGVGAGFFMMWKMMSSIQAQNQPEITEEEDEEADEEEEKGIGVIYSLNPFLVNLADRGGKRYLKITIDLELSDDKMKQEIVKRLPQVRNLLLMILPSKTFTDVSTVDGKTSLRDEILTELNGILTTGEVSNLYFTEFVIQ